MFTKGSDRSSMHPKSPSSFFGLATPLRDFLDNCSSIGKQIPGILSIEPRRFSWFLFV